LSFQILGVAALGMLVIANQWMHEFGTGAKPSASMLLHVTGYFNLIPFWFPG